MATVAGRSRMATVAGRSRMATVAGRSRMAPVAGRSRMATVAGRSRMAPVAGRSRMAPVAGRSVALGDAQHPIDGALDELGKGKLSLDMKRRRCDLAVFGVAGDLPRRADDGEARRAERVIAPHIQRVFAGVEAGSASLDAPLMLERLADLELIATAAKIAVEALVRHNFGRRYSLDLLLRLGSHNPSVQPGSHLITP